METAKETAKVNGKGKGKKAQATIKPVEKPKAAKETGWSIARTMLASGSKDEAIKKAVHDHLAKTTDPKDALEYYCQRMAYRALFRAKRTAKAAKKGATNATK